MAEAGKGEAAAAAASPRFGGDKPAIDWEDRVRREKGWLTEDGAQDSYTGRRTREFVSKYCTEKENETPKMIATKFDVPVEDLLALNNVRFFGDKLMSSSKLRNKTKLLVPTRRVEAVGSMGAAAVGVKGDQKEDATFVDGNVVATNYLIWLVQHEDGEVVELTASEVQEACWNFRRTTEGWSEDPTKPHMGAKVRRVFPQQIDPITKEVYAVNGVVVGYLPQGKEADDFEMWHMVHEGGDDDEDLDEGEVVAGIKCYKEYEAQPPPVFVVDPEYEASLKGGAGGAAKAGSAAAPAAKKKGKARPAPAASGAGPQKKARKKKDPNAPKNPRTPFVWFHQKTLADMKLENPSTKFGEAGKKAGELWRAMDSDQRAPFVQKAKDDKERYQEEMKNYVPPEDKPEPVVAPVPVPVVSSDSDSSESESSESEESDDDDDDDADPLKTKAAAVEKAAYELLWKELSDKQKSAAEALGYAGAEQWESGEVPPGTVGSHWELDPEVVRSWEEMSPELLAAAKALGYEKWTWDQAMRDGALPADDAESSMFLQGEECYAFDSEGKAYQAVVKKTRKVLREPTVPSPAKPDSAAAGSTEPDGDGKPGKEGKGDKKTEGKKASKPAGAAATKRWEYFIHYQGWKNKWDVWMTNESIFKKNEENAKLCTDSADVTKGPGAYKKDREAEKEKIRLAEKKKKDREKKKERRAAKKARREAKRAAKLEKKKAKAAAKAKASAVTLLDPNPPPAKAGAKRSQAAALGGNPPAKRKRKSKAEADGGRGRNSGGDKTLLPELLEIQMENDYTSMHEGKKVVLLPRDPTAAKVLEDFLAAKLKSIQSKISKEMRIKEKATAALQNKSGHSPQGGAAAPPGAPGGEPAAPPPGPPPQAEGDAPAEGSGEQPQSGQPDGKKKPFRADKVMYWSEAEDELLMSMVESDGATDWSTKAEKLGTKRTPEAVYKHYKIVVAQRAMTQEKYRTGNFAMAPRAPPRRKYPSDYKDPAMAGQVVRRERSVNQYPPVSEAQKEEERALLQPWSEVVDGLRDYLNGMLVPYLLYPHEQPQVEEARRIYPDRALADLYGPEHLLRLLVALPEIASAWPNDHLRNDVFSKVYGQHGFARWFERHYYDWFHDHEKTYTALTDEELRVGQGEADNQGGQDEDKQQGEKVEKATDGAAMEVEGAEEGKDGAPAAAPPQEQSQAGAGEGQDPPGHDSTAKFGVRPPPAPQVGSTPFPCLCQPIGSICKSGVCRAGANRGPLQRVRRADARPGTCTGIGSRSADAGIRPR